MSRLAGGSDRSIAVAIGIVASVAYTAPAIGNPTTFDYFARLARAFSLGQYWLDGAPPHLNELVPGVGGHLYSVFPPLPAILLLPLLPFGDAAAAQTLASALLGALSSVPLYLAQRALGIPRSLAIWTTVLSVFGTTLWVTAVDGRAWFAANATGMFFASVALQRAARGSTLSTGVALGAAALARTPIVLAAPGLLLLALSGTRNGAFARGVALFALGAAPFIVIQASYDLARWGTPLDVGYQLLSSNDPFYALGIFSVTYLPRHLYAILFEPPAFVDGQLLFLRARFVGMSMLWSTPALVWLARAALVGRSFRPTLALALACIAIAPDLLFGTVGFEQYGYRRSLDVQAFFIPLVAVGAGWTGVDWRAPSALFRVAVAASVVITLYFLVTIRIFGYAR